MITIAALTLTLFALHIPACERPEAAEIRETWQAFSDALNAGDGKTAVSLVVLGFVAYVALGFEINGRPLGEHLLDVWRSPVMQEKVDLVRGEMKRELEEKLARMPSTTN